MNLFSGLKLRSKHTTIGMEITNEQVKLCELAVMGRELQVLEYDTVDLPPDTMNDGRVNNAFQLEETVRELLAKKKWSTRQVNLAIPSQTVLLKTIKLPDVSDDQLEKLIKYELDNQVNLPFEHPHYDFMRVRSLKTESHIPEEGSSEEAMNQPDDSNLCEILVAAAPMEMLYEYVSLLEKVKLMPTCFEIKAFSLMRLQQRCMPITEGSWVWIDCNASNCDITIVDQGFFRLTRNVEIHFQMEETMGDAFSQFITPEQYFENACQDLISEFERLLNFYRYSLNNRSWEVNVIVLSGGLKNMDQLMAYLSSRMSQSVLPADWGSAQVNHNSRPIDVSAYAVPIGLALRGNRR